MPVGRANRHLIRILIHRALFFLELLVEDGGGYLLVRHYPVCTDATAERTDDHPTDEAELELEISPSVALHQPLALVDALLPTEIGIVVLDVEHHSVGVSNVNTGDNEHASPYKRVEHVHKTDLEVVEEVVKALEEILYLNATVALNEIKVHRRDTDGERTYENVEDEELNDIEQNGYSVEEEIRNSAEVLEKHGEQEHIRKRYENAARATDYRRHNERNHHGCEPILAEYIVVKKNTCSLTYLRIRKIHICLRKNYNSID